MFGIRALIPSNIAEGAGRQRKRSQFLHIAQASASEIDTQLEIAFRLGYLGDADKTKFDVQINNIGKMINGLQRSLRT